jgi:hypothetical protein
MKKWRKNGELWKEADMKAENRMILLPKSLFQTVSNFADGHLSQEEFRSNLASQVKRFINSA